MTLEVGKVAGNFYEIVIQKLIEHFEGHFTDLYIRFTIDEAQCWFNKGFIDTGYCFKRQNFILQGTLSF